MNIDPPSLVDYGHALALLVSGGSVNDSKLVVDVNFQLDVTRAPSLLKTKHFEGGASEEAK